MRTKQTGSEGKLEIKGQDSSQVNVDSAARTENVKRHITLTFAYKTLAIGLSYLLVPLVVNYLDVERYGIWVTMLSVMSWVAFFDIGLGNGLRNKLAEALVVKDIRLAKTYVSTAYVTISGIVSVAFVVLISTARFIPWAKVFNTTSVSSAELFKVVLIAGGVSLMNLILSLCNQVFYACQQASFVAMRQLLMNLFALLAVFLLIHYTSGTLLYLSAGYGLAMLLSSLLLTEYLYLKRRDIFPSPRYVALGKVKEIASLGVKFFVIQIAALIIFTTDNMIIIQTLGPAQVTPYNIVFKLFSIITMAHALIMAPLWSAYTDAYAKGDIQWIKNVLKKLNLLMIPIVLVVAVLIAFTREIVSIWVGSRIEIPYLLPLLMGIYAVVFVWSNVYAYFVNGLGKIRPQLCSSIIAGIINVPVSIYFARNLGMGSSGVILGTIVSLSLFAIVGPLQTYYLVRKKFTE